MRPDPVRDSTDVLTPDWRPTPLWWEDVPLLPADEPLPQRADVAVIGAGYGGLMTAITLAEAGASVVVLDAGMPGQGAATRNHGHIGGAGRLPAGLDRLVGSERAALIREDAVALQKFLRDLIVDRGLDVDHVERGRFLAAHSPKAYQALLRRAEQYRRDFGLTVHAVPREEQRREIGSNFYHGGIVQEEAGALQPAKLFREMWRLATRAGALVRGGARVKAILRTGAGFRLETVRGSIAADHVVAATSAYTDRALPEIRRRIIPVTAYMVATEAMAPDLAAALLPANRTGGDTKRALFAFRRSHDGRRIIFAGRARFRDIDERRSSRILHGFMTQVWPEMRGVRISHGWKGRIGFTFDHIPHMGEAGGIHYSVGNGIANMVFLGHQIALKVLRRQNRPCGFESTVIPTMPFYQGVPWFLPIVGGYYTLRDRLDRATAHRTT